MTNKIKDFDATFNKKLQSQSSEERMKAGLKKLAQEMEVNRDSIKEPDGLASGTSDKKGKMIIDLEVDYDDEQD